LIDNITRPATGHTISLNEISNCKDDSNWKSETEDISVHSLPSGNPKNSNLISRLRRQYGCRFLIFIYLSCCWCKGFCRSQLAQSIRYYLQSRNVSGPSIDLYSALVDSPWSMKPIFALMSDLFPIFGYRKIPYLLLGLVCGILGISIAGLSNSGPLEISLVGLFLSSLSWMIADILTEGRYTHEITTNPECGPDLIVFITAGQQVCYFISSIVSGAILESMDGFLGLRGSQWNLLICLIPMVLLLFAISANYLGETPIRPQDARESRRSIWTNNRNIIFLSVIVGSASLIFAIFGICVWNIEINFALALFLWFLVNLACWFYLTPTVSKAVVFLSISSITNLSIGGPAHYFYTDTAEQYPEGPHFEPWFLVTVCGIIASVSAVFALLIFSKFKASFYKSVFMSLIAANVVSSCFSSIIYSRVDLGVPDELLVVIDSVVQSVNSVLSSIPVVLLLSRLCTDRLESSSFAILASTTNLSQTLVGLISGYFCYKFGIEPSGRLNESEEFRNLWICNFIMSGIKLLPLLAVPLLPAVRMMDTIQ
jgi:hypothetical protein